MGTLSYTIPTAGSTLNSVADPEVATALQAVLTWANGSIDAINLSAVLAQSASVNQSGQTVKGLSNVSTSEARTNTAYGTLPTPDQVTGVVLPSNGLLRIWYQATWQESVNQAARAAIFIGATQLKAASNTGPNADVQAAITTAAAGTATPTPLSTSFVGLVSGKAGYSGGDVTTGQIVGVNDASGVTYELGSSTYTGAQAMGGPVYVFAAAGTYTVSVQYKASSGSVTAANRKLWVEAVSFS